MHSCRLPGLRASSWLESRVSMIILSAKSTEALCGGSSEGCWQSLAHKRPQLRKGGFGVELGEVPSPRLSLSRLVFTANWMVVLIISAFGFHFSNNPSVEGPDQPPNRYEVSPHLDPANRLLSDLCSDHNEQRKRKWSTVSTPLWQ